MNRPPPAPGAVHSTPPPMIRKSTDHHEWVGLDTHRFGGQRKAFLINKHAIKDNQWSKLGDLGPAVMKLVEGGVEKGVY
jgi:hypothetical protein